MATAVSQSLYIYGVFKLDGLILAVEVKCYSALSVLDSVRGFLVNLLPVSNEFVDSIDILVRDRRSEFRAWRYPVKKLK
jgi:hypothetical protein